MSLSTNKIILAGANAVTNTAGAYFQYSNVVASTSGVTIPAGAYVGINTTNVVVQINTSSNPAALSWSNISTVNVAIPYFVSDGVNIRATSTTGTPTLVLVTTNGGQAVSGTFN